MKQNSPNIRLYINAGLYAIFVCLISLTQNSCTTATYGRSFMRDESKTDQYKFRIYAGGFAGPKTADQRAKIEISNFMDWKPYGSYEITDRRYNLVPSYYEYTVHFSRTNSTINPQ